MKRSAPLRRTGFKRPSIERPAVVLTPVPERLRRAVSMGRISGGAAAMPKGEARRNPALLAMARGRPCLFNITGICTFDTSTTVAAHSNSGAHGKGLGRKADDHYSAWACAACHGWLDQGRATQARKQAAFDAALRRQIGEWSRISSDGAEPERFRKAAAWALDLHQYPAKVVEISCGIAIYG